MIARLSRVARLVRDLGPRRGAKIAVDRVWSSDSFFGLTADLTSLPEPRRARISVTMEPRDAENFRGCADELTRVSPDELLDVRMRDLWCKEGVLTLYVATDSDGGEIYAQWLIDAETQPRFGRPGIHILEPLPRLAADEVFVEGAYTFARNRRQGAMVDGMHQLLSRARDRGARRCFTYGRPRQRPVAARLRERSASCPITSGSSAGGSGRPRCRAASWTPAISRDGARPWGPRPPRRLSGGCPRRWSSAPAGTSGTAS